MFIESTRNKVRKVVEQHLRVLREYDSIVFQDVDMGPDEAFEIVPDQGAFVVALVDPTIEDFGLDCYD